MAHLPSTSLGAPPGRVRYLPASNVSKLPQYLEHGYEVLNGHSGLNVVDGTKYVAATLAEDAAALLYFLSYLYETFRWLFQRSQKRLFDS